MKIVTFCFPIDPVPTPQYVRMAQVLRISVEENSPDTPCEVRHITELCPHVTQRLPRYRRTWYFIRNVIKTYYHHQYVQQLDDGEIVGLFDSDTFVLRDLSPILPRLAHADLVITTQSGFYPVNTGVLFVKVSKEVKEFFEKWYDTAQRMLENKPFHDPWYSKYGGINQASLGYLTENQLHGIHIAAAPCSEWNCTSNEFEAYPKELPRVVHLLGELKGAIKNNRKRCNGVNADYFYQRWCEYDRKVKVVA